MPKANRNGANGIQKAAKELQTFRSELEQVGGPSGDTKALKAFLGCVMVGVANGHISPAGLNSISNAAGKILRTVELEHRLGSKGIAKLQPIDLT